MLCFSLQIKYYVLSTYSVKILIPFTAILRGKSLACFLNIFQATQDSTLMIKRMWRYLGPVLVVSVLINITKFFELCVVTTEEGKYNFSVTDLRRNITYSTITNWTRLIFMGALPLVIIVYFNMKVYQDVRERSAKNFKKRNQQVRR